jgi:hypothetical protein
VPFLSAEAHGNAAKVVLRAVAFNPGYENDPRKWLRLPWIDRYSGKRYAVHTGPMSGLASSSVAYLNSYRDVFEEY